MIKKARINNTFNPYFKQLVSSNIITTLYIYSYYKYLYRCIIMYYNIYSWYALNAEVTLLVFTIYAWLCPRKQELTLVLSTSGRCYCLNGLRKLNFIKLPIRGRPKKISPNKSKTANSLKRTRFHNRFFNNWLRTSNAGSPTFDQYLEVSWMLLIVIYNGWQVPNMYYIVLMYLLT